VELERRIAAALDRIGQGIEGLSAPNAPVATDGGATEIAVQLEDERMANAQLAERLRLLKDRESQLEAEAEARIARMTRQLDTQAQELQRMRKTVVQLRETLRALHEAATAGLADPALVNRALLAEADALRATRQTELALMDEILEELAPLIPETSEDA
jgi:chromosome segregation ATPase